MSGFGASPARVMASAGRHTSQSVLYLESQIAIAASARATEVRPKSLALSKELAFGRYLRKITRVWSYCWPTGLYVPSMSLAQ